MTPQGVTQADRFVGAHRLWEACLAKHFNVAADHLHVPAERMEPHISPELDGKLRDQLTRPPHGPHGRPIPPGRVEEST